MEDQCEIHVAEQSPIEMRKRLNHPLLRASKVEYSNTPLRWMLIFSGMSPLPKIPIAVSVLYRFFVFGAMIYAYYVAIRDGVSSGTSQLHRISKGLCTSLDALSCFLPFFLISLRFEETFQFLSQSVDERKLRSLERSLGILWIAVSAIITGLR